MSINILEYDSFMKESMSPQEAVDALIKHVKDGYGWIDPDYAIEMFTDMTGLDPADQIVDSMLAKLADLDMLYYEDEYSSDKKGKKVEFGQPELKQMPQRAPKDMYMGPAYNESKLINIKEYSSFNCSINEQLTITSLVSTPEVVENFFRKNVKDVMGVWTTLEDLKKLYSVLSPLSGKMVKGISKCFFYEPSSGEKQSKPINTKVLNYINSLNARSIQDRCSTRNAGGPEYMYLYDEIKSVGTRTLGKEGDLMKKKLLDLFDKDGKNPLDYFGNPEK